MSIRKARKQIHYHSNQRWAITIILFIIIGIFIFSQISTWNHINSEYDQEKHLAVLGKIKTKRDEIRTTKIEDRKPKKLNPKRFNPNTVSLEELTSMGLKEKDAKSWTNYTSKGGKFYKTEDLNRLYSMNEDVYNQLAPFVDIPQSDKKRYKKKKYYESSNQYNNDKNKKFNDYEKYTKDSIYSISSNSIDSSQKERIEYNAQFKQARNERGSGIADDFVISINITDSTELQILDGIGPVLSSRIIKYRDKLGGFHNMNQLLEVYGVKPGLVSQIVDRLNFEGEMNKIPLNIISVKELVKHPYFDYATANIFVNYRSHHGDFRDIEDVKKIRVIKDYWLEEAQPYFSYSPSNIE